MDMIKLRMNDVVDNENNDIDIDPVLLALTQWMMTESACYVVRIGNPQPV